MLKKFMFRDLLEAKAHRGLYSVRKQERRKEVEGGNGRCMYVSACPTKCLLQSSTTNIAARAEGRKPKKDLTSPSRELSVYP